jgi:hypothetical protein
MKALALISSAAMLAGCATGVRVDYLSEPSAAVVYEDGAPKGVTPLTLYYEPDASFKAGGCLNTKPMSVKWASGATAGISYLSLCANQGTTQHYVFQRPDVPGRDVDMNYALQVERNQIMRAQAAAQIIQASTLLQPPPPPRMVNCSSNRMGTTVHTTCY